MKFIGLLIAILIFCNRLAESNADESFSDIRSLLTEFLMAIPMERCFAIITDSLYHHLYDEHFFKYAQSISYFHVQIHEDEDLLAPHYQTVRMLHEIGRVNCDLYFVTMQNGWQVKRLLHFINKNRILNLKKKFVFLHDLHLLEADTTAIWSNMLSSVLIERPPSPRMDGEEEAIYTLTTISYARLLSSDFVVTEALCNWKVGRRVKVFQVFPDKSSNLQGLSLPVVIFEHVPMVRRDSMLNSFVGLEVEIVRALGKAMHFRPIFYETTDSIGERWGRRLPNGSYTGLIGQLTNRSARIAIGDLHMYRRYTEVMDLSRPHSHECLTFLTPESSQDNSWKTLIQPFSGAMWTGVLLSLFMVGSVFYLISYLHDFLLRQTRRNPFQFFARLRKQPPNVINRDIFRDVHFRRQLFHWQAPRQPHPDLFDSYSNCILLTFSMLLYVALPRMPVTWPLRVLTGWYWMYCILLTVTYRASFTAILANPAARITIDTLSDLVRSGIAVTAWVHENKLFFEDSFDDVAQDIGSRLEIIDNIYGLTERIAQGYHSYYDNVYFLRYLRLNGTRTRHSEADIVLHIMKECVVYMPVSLGLEKNSPLKPHIDMYIQRLIEGGLVAKWLQDSVKDLPAEELAPQEALMDLSKIWSSFVALAIGYALAVAAIIAELLYFKWVVQRHPLYNEFNPKVYYNFKRKYPDL